MSNGLILWGGSPNKLGRYWRCQAAVWEQDSYRQCRRASDNEKYGTISVFNLCHTHAKLGPVNGKLTIIKVD